MFEYDVIWCRETIAWARQDLNRKTFYYPWVKIETLNSTTQGKKIKYNSLKLHQRCKINKIRLSNFIDMFSQERPIVNGRAEARCNFPYYDIYNYLNRSFNFTQFSVFWNIFIPFLDTTPNSAICNCNYFELCFYNYWYINFCFWTNFFVLRKLQVILPFTYSRSI